MHLVVHQDSKHSPCALAQAIAAFCVWRNDAVCKMPLKTLRTRMSINYFYPTLVIPLIIFSPVSFTIENPSSCPLLSRDCLIFFQLIMKITNAFWRLEESCA